MRSGKILNTPGNADRGTPQKFHVLTVHYNTPELTSNLVQCLPRQSPYGRAVYVHILDNASTPAARTFLRRNLECVPHISYEESDTNLGFGEGVNKLAASGEIAPSDVIWILNPDTRLGDGCIEKMEQELHTGNFAVISPLIYSGSDSDPQIWYCGGNVAVPYLHPHHDYSGRDVDAAPVDPFETEFITGAAPMMYASTFRAVGGFPPGYFLYWEDAYFSSRARGLGMRLGVVPSAHLWHAVGASSGCGRSRTYFYWSARNRFKYAIDIGIPRRKLILGRGGIESLRPLAAAILFEKDGRLPKVKAALRGTLDGLKLSSSPRTDFAAGDEK